MRVLVMLPTYNEIENIQDVLERAPSGTPRGRHPGHRRRQSRRHRRPGREARRGPRWHRRAAPRAEVGPRLGVPRRVPGRPRARLRRHDRDGRRPLARPRGAARSGRRGRARRRPRHRLALRARRLDPRLEVAAPRHLPRRRPLRPHHARPLGARRHRRLPRLPPRQPLAHRPRPRAGRRLRVPGGDDLPHRAQRRPASSRCRSRSATAASGRSKMSCRIVVEAFLLVTWWGVRDRAPKKVLHARDTEGMAALRVHRRGCARGVARRSPARPQPAAQRRRPTGARPAA